MRPPTLPRGGPLHAGCGRSFAPTHRTGSAGARRARELSAGCAPLVVEVWADVDAGSTVRWPESLTRARHMRRNGKRRSRWSRDVEARRGENLDHLDILDDVWPTALSSNSPSPGTRCRDAHRAAPTDRAVTGNRPPTPTSCGSASRPGTPSSPADTPTA